MPGDVVIEDSVDPGFVGRAEVLGAFRATLDRALGGRRQILTLSGEPGIGKTRCAEAFARAAEDQGALVFWGRCYEEPGAPPYWPWVQVLRDFVTASSPSEVQLAMGRGVHEIASILPEIADGKAPAPASFGGDDSDPTQRRFKLFDAIGQFFKRATQQVPIVVILDNLHWADAPSLSLLEFLCGELQRSRWLVVGTYRDNEVSRKSPLLRTLGGFGTDAGVARIRLGGLSEPAIATLAERLMGSRLSPDVASSIYRQTDGNPLFVIELIKVLVEEGADAGIEPVTVRVPDGIREAIGRRLSRLPDRANGVLGIASVIGRIFTVAEVASVGKLDAAVVIQDLGAAADAGIVEVGDETRAEYRFVHALIRETLYDEIPTLERVSLHGRVADALVAAYAGDPGPALSRIAHHYYETAALGSIDKAAEYAALAADYAWRVHAYEDALTHYDHVISVFTVNGNSSDERLVRALFLKGQTLIQMGSVQPAIHALLKAASVAKGLGNAELLVDVASELVLSTSHSPQGQAVALLEKALMLLPESDLASGAKARAALAFARRTLGRSEGVEELTEQAVGMAERASDTRTLGHCLGLALMALRDRPETLERRLALGQRWIDVALRVEGYELAHAYAWQTLHLLEQGHIDEAAAMNERVYERAADRHLLFEYYAASTRVLFALLRGEWTGLEDAIESLLVRGRRTRPGDAEGVYGVQMFALNRELGRLDTLKPLVEAFAASESGRAWKPGLMLMCAEVGLVDEARALLDDVGCRGFGRLAKDDMFAAQLVYCAETCCALGAASHARTLYELLLPYADQTLCHPRVVCFGPARLLLGKLAFAAGAKGAAHEHLAAAVKICSTIRAWPVLARALYHCGVALLDSEAERARALLAEADELANRLGMAGLARDIDRLTRNRVVTTTFPDNLTVREVDVLRLIAIGRSNKDVSVVLGISLNTVATHVRNILTKTGCANRTEAAAYALRNDLVERGSNPFSRASSES